LIDSLLSTTYSPPPTQPPSPVKSSSDEDEPESPPPVEDSTPPPQHPHPQIKSEPPTEPASIASDDLDYQNDIEVDCADFLAGFDDFDTFEKLTSDKDYQPLTKRTKFDSECSENEFLIKSDCLQMWNGTEEIQFHSEIEIKEEKFDTDDDEEEGDDDEHDLEFLRSAFQNDHSYATTEEEPSKDKKMNYETLLQQKIINFDKMPMKKTKILVPLKDLMQSLQQKSYLVSPIGPGKNIIKLTNGETVKGNHYFKYNHLKIIRRLATT
jgi:hypothetical protein